MKIYLVGGAVRDQLLGLPVGERDWVVVGATPEELAAEGYKPVGRDFPVFLHPATHEEYALARTERKTAPGYRGFVVHAAADVTLEQDLARRDLTINAIAWDAATKQYVDPYGGRRDLEMRILRHVSPAFIEDPLRILRVARFAARFAPLGFTIAPDTSVLMRKITESGELDALVPERVWQETVKALTTQAPHVYFSVLDQVGALAAVFPELHRTPAGIESLRAIATVQSDPLIRYAIVTHPLALDAMEQLCARLRVPTEYRELATLVAAHRHAIASLLELTPDAVVRLLESVDAFRRPGRFERLLTACEVIAKSLSPSSAPEHRYNRIRALHNAAHAAKVDGAALANLTGPEIAERVRALRTAAVAAALADVNAD